MISDTKNLVRFVGDIHGKWHEYQMILQDCEHPSVQVGDFGVGFQGPYWHDRVNDFHASRQHRFIRGNHDNPEMCKQEMVGYIPDGTVEGDVMFIGGAWSIDNPVAPPGWYRRTAGVDWWDDEECSDEEFEQMFEIYKQTKPKVMITHDCPARVSYEMFWGSGFIKGAAYPNRTSSWFEKFIYAHQPEFHFFGHWHKSMAYKHGNTTYVCLGELDYIDVDLSDSDQIHEAIYDKFKT